MLYSTNSLIIFLVQNSAHSDQRVWHSTHASFITPDTVSKQICIHVRAMYKIYSDQNIWQYWEDAVSACIDTGGLSVLVYDDLVSGDEEVVFFVGLFVYMSDSVSEVQGSEWVMPSSATI